MVRKEQSAWKFREIGTTTRVYIYVYILSYTAQKNIAENERNIRRRQMVFTRRRANWVKNDRRIKREESLAARRLTCYSCFPWSPWSSLSCRVECKGWWRPKGRPASRSRAATCRPSRSWRYSGSVNTVRRLCCPPSVSSRSLPSFSRISPASRELQFYRSALHTKNARCSRNVRTGSTLLFPK